MTSTAGSFTFSKKERLCGKMSVSALVSHGKWGGTEHLKYCFSPRNEDDAEFSRLLVSVPKRFFKRAVRRNLLKRRIREAYRTQKSLCTGKTVDLLIQYNSTDIIPFAAVREEVASILTSI